MKKQFTLKLNPAIEWAICDENGKPASDGLCKTGMDRVFNIPTDAEELILTLSTQKTKGSLCVLLRADEDSVSFPCLDTEYNPYILSAVRRGVLQGMDKETVNLATSRVTKDFLMYAKLSVVVTKLKDVTVKKGHR